MKKKCSSRIKNIFNGCIFFRCLSIYAKTRLIDMLLTLRTCRRCFPSILSLYELFFLEVVVTMAMNYLNEIVSVFLDRNVAYLRDNELSNAIKVKDNTCSPEEICRITNALPSLFQLRYYQNGTFLVYVAPTVNFFNICFIFNNISVLYVVGCYM